MLDSLKEFTGETTIYTKDLALITASISQNSLGARRMRTASSLGGIGCSGETKEGFPEVVSPALSLKDNRKLGERAEKAD